MERIALFALLLLSCLLTSCHVNKDYDLNGEIDARMVLARGITFPIGDVGGGIKYGMVIQKGATPDADPIETDQVDLGSFDVSRFGLMQPGGVGLAVEGGVPELVEGPQQRISLLRVCASSLIYGRKERSRP